ncbi:hypothetical protein ACLMJK_003306 [Lecanora helva]
MRYFDDGDLTDGLKTAIYPPSVNFLEGDYHVVWTFCNNKRSTLDWSANTVLSEWDFTFRHTEGQDERHFDVVLHFGTLDLEYTMEYQDKTVNHLELVRNNSPGDGEVEKVAMLAFSDARDEQGFPYLRCNFATNEHDPDREMVNIEFIAKRTDTEGIQQLGLTKNEKLRLGYPVWDDGTFEPEDSEEEVNNQNVDSLNKQLQRHIEASLKIHSKLVNIQNHINKQVTNATNGMQQAMQQAWRSVSHPAANIIPTYEQGNPTSPPPAKRRKQVTAGAEDPEQTPSPQRRRKGGPESTPLSMEQDITRSGSGSQRRKRGGAVFGGGSGRGGKRKSMRAST